MRQVPARGGLSVDTIVLSIFVIPYFFTKQPPTLLKPFLPIRVGNARSTGRRHLSSS